MIRFRTRCDQSPYRKWPHSCPTFQLSSKIQTSSKLLVSDSMALCQECRRCRTRFWLCLRALTLLCWVSRESFATRARKASPDDTEGVEAWQCHQTTLWLTHRAFGIFIVYLNWYRDQASIIYSATDLQAWIGCFCNNPLTRVTRVSWLEEPLKCANRSSALEGGDCALRIYTAFPQQPSMSLHTKILYHLVFFSLKELIGFADIELSLRIVTPLIIPNSLCHLATACL